MIITKIWESTINKLYWRSEKSVSCSTIKHSMSAMRPFLWSMLPKLIYSEKTSCGYTEFPSHRQQNKVFSRVHPSLHSLFIKLSRHCIYALCIIWSDPPQWALQIYGWANCLNVSRLPHQFSFAIRGIVCGPLQRCSLPKLHSLNGAYWPRLRQPEYFPAAST